MNIFSHRNKIVLFLACNMAAMQNLYWLEKGARVSFANHSKHAAFLTN